MRKQTMVWMGVTLAVLLAAGTLVWLTRVSGSARVPIGAVSVAAGAEQRTLDLHLTYSSCDEVDRVEIKEDARTVRLTVYVHGLPSCGTVPMTSQVVQARLARPLSGRTAVDGDTGAAIRTR